MKEIWIVGAGFFGNLALNRLDNGKIKFVIVDAGPDNLEKLKGPNRNIIQEDGIAFLDKNLRENKKPDWIIPALPVHLAAEWCLLKLGPEKISRIIIALLLAMGLGAIYWLWHSFGMAGISEMNVSSMDELMSQISRYEAILTKYYLYLFALVVGLSVLFAVKLWSNEKLRNSASLYGVAAALIIIPSVMWLASYSNLRIIRLDAVCSFKSYQQIQV